MEIRQDRAWDGGSGAPIPRLIGQTSRAQPAKERAAEPARRPAPRTEAEVLDSITQAGADPAVAQAVIGWPPRTLISG